MVDYEDCDIAHIIESRLIARFAPEQLSVKNVSFKHVGHVGARSDSQTHFEIDISSEAFSGLGRLAAHRLIHKELADLLAGPIHALNIKLS